MGCKQSKQDCGGVANSQTATPTHHTHSPTQSQLEMYESAGMSQPVDVNDIGVGVADYNHTAADVPVLDSPPPPPSSPPPPLPQQHSRANSSNISEGWEEAELKRMEAQMLQSRTRGTIDTRDKGKYKTFRPPKQHKTLNRTNLHKSLRANLNNHGVNNLDTLKGAVKVPHQEDICEWHAVNILEFYNDVSLLFGILEDDLCVSNRQQCTVMSAGPHEYLWADGVKVKQPLKVSAPEYMAYMMDWVAAQLEDPRLFPTKPGVPYPDDFVPSVKVVFKRLFRAYAHFYHAHFDDYHSLGMQDHVNKCFRHFMLYVKEFDLVSEKDQAPLKDFIPQILDSNDKQ